jgi:hypothetical protein
MSASTRCPICGAEGAELCRNSITGKIRDRRHATREQQHADHD